MGPLLPNAGSDPQFIILASLVSGFRPSGREKKYNSQNEGKDYTPGIYINKRYVIFPTCHLGDFSSLYLPTSHLRKTFEPNLKKIPPPRPNLQGVWMFQLS